MPDEPFRTGQQPASARYQQHRRMSDPRSNSGLLNHTISRPWRRAQHCSFAINRPNLKGIGGYSKGTVSRSTSSRSGGIGLVPLPHGSTHWTFRFFQSIARKPLLGATDEPATQSPVSGLRFETSACPSFRRDFFRLPAGALKTPTVYRFATSSRVAFEGARVV